MSETGVSIFSPDFLKLISRRDPSPTATPEAAWCGPWRVETHGDEYAVVSDGEPEAVVASRELALLLAAVLPGCGRGQLYWLGESADGAYPVTLRTVLDARGMADVGRLRHRSEELLAALSTAEYFLRSPAALAYLLEASPLETLRRAELAGRLRLAEECESC